MKGVLKSNDGRPFSSDVTMNNKFNSSQDPSQNSNKKEKGGRFSLGIFGNKKDKKSNKESRDSLQRLTSNDILISGPPGGGPVVMDGSANPYVNNNNNINTNNSNPNGMATSSSKSSSIIPTSQPIMDTSIPNASNYPQQSNNNDTTTKQSDVAYGYSETSNQLSDGTPIMHYARAVWSFTATIPLEMSFSAGDRLAIVKKQADGWWDAELQGPKKTRGLVPGNYMET
ncbi:uncharacterized protein BX664DRAFT_343865, partial [Halteromyces radiatus]|uniref:uncharacterized protein n=1 Tax=Halteromyces radiatus TaxID=101107 RepID=UPI002220733F